MKENVSKIDQSMVIKGDIVTSSKTFVEGVVDGSFVGNELKVSATGSVFGEVKGKLVDCAGRLEGRVETESLILRTGGSQVGTVVTGALEVEPGAVLDCALQSGADLSKKSSADTAGASQATVDLAKYLDAFSEENRPCCFEVPWSERFELYKHIRSLLAKKKPLIKVVGEGGSGKTSLAAKLCAEPAEDQLIVEIEKKVGSVTELLGEVASLLEIELKGERQADAIDAIRGELKKRNANGQNVVVVIDDAQEMFQATMEGVIRLLSGACGEEEIPFDEIIQIILLGTQEMRENMVATIIEYFEDETNCQLFLDPLNMKDTADYLRLGVQMVSEGDDNAAMSILPNETIKEIHVRSKGSISDINLLAARGLMEASVRGEGCLLPLIIKDMAAS